MSTKPGVDHIRRIERYSGVKLAKAFAIGDLDREVKWHCRYALDGLLQPDISSGDPVANWVSRLLKIDPCRRLHRPAAPVTNTAKLHTSNMTAGNYPCQHKLCPRARYQLSANAYFPTKLSFIHPNSVNLSTGNDVSKTRWRPARRSRRKAG